MALERDKKLNEAAKAAKRLAETGAGYVLGRDAGTPDAASRELAKQILENGNPDELANLADGHSAGLLSRMEAEQRRLEAENDN